MSEKVTGLTTRVLNLIRPASALLTFGQRPLAAARGGGGAVGIMNYYKDEVIPNWHPPTLEGFGNALAGPMGMGIVNSLLGRAVKYIGGIAGVDVVSTIGEAIKDGGEGQAIGGLADLVVHAHAYNPTSPISMGGGHGTGRGYGKFGKGKGKVSDAPGIGTAHRHVRGGAPFV